MHLNGATGEPLTARFVRIEMKGRTLRGLPGKIDQRRVYFVNGEVQTGKIEPIANIDLYQPVTYSGQTMTLHYARAQELGVDPTVTLVANSPGSFTSRLEGRQNANNGSGLWGFPPATDRPGSD